MQELGNKIKYQISKHTGNGNALTSYDTLKEINKLGDEIMELVEQEVKIINLKHRIKYQTLVARHKRVFLGGGEDARLVKQLVRRLKVQLKREENGRTTRSS